LSPSEVDPVPDLVQVPVVSKAISELRVRWTGQQSAMSKALAVLVAQRALHVDLAADAAEHPDVLFALCAVLGVDPVVRVCS